MPTQQSHPAIRDTEAPMTFPQILLSEMKSLEG
jgi:hypothetical protein